eukprot:1194634-Prorocentrum_minimum.AAC.5
MLKWAGATSSGAGQMSVGLIRTTTVVTTMTPPCPLNKRPKKKHSRTVKGGKYQNTASNRAMRKAFWKSFINKNQKGNGSASSS